MSQENILDKKPIDKALLQRVFDTVLFPKGTPPEDNTVVTGSLNAEKVHSLKQAGIEYVINLQPDSELTFDEKLAVAQAGMGYAHVPIRGAEDLKQVTIMNFDKALRQSHGKNTVIHCQSGNRVGAAIALRGGWLRGRKMDTVMAWGKEHGLTGLEEEVRTRLLVPR